MYTKRQLSDLLTTLLGRLKSWTLSWIGISISVEAAPSSTSLERAVNRESLLRRTSEKLSNVYKDISSIWKLTRSQRKTLTKLAHQFRHKANQRERLLKRAHKLDKQLDKLAERMVALEVCSDVSGRGKDTRA